MDLAPDEVASHEGIAPQSTRSAQSSRSDLNFSDAGSTRAAAPSSISPVGSVHTSNPASVVVPPSATSVASIRSSDSGSMCSAADVESVPSPIPAGEMPDSKPGGGTPVSSLAGSMLPVAGSIRSGASVVSTDASFGTKSSLGSERLFWTPEPSPTITPPPSLPEGQPAEGQLNIRVRPFLMTHSTFVYFSFRIEGSRTLRDFVEAVRSRHMDTFWFRKLGFGYCGCRDWMYVHFLSS
ncbi:hypothetical protein BD410DRAFT_434562 [Rickenella mellea]|uniref:Uncharacterized protein n=1 Tax=Rickenella mellea TaxID=50990 RepID=A0A4Y7PYL9_9AGAM|nr:hypothetical protein BD410DRAFT_434562 [Rickenella mellea]